MTRPIDSSSSASFPAADTPSRNGRPVSSRSVSPVLISMMAVALCGWLLPGTVLSQTIGEGPGIQARLGHVEGQGIIQYRSITPVELMPYYLLENQLIYADLRFFPTNSLELGGNAGLGYRYHSASLDRIFGGSLWYDGDNTRGVYFQQLGLSLETLAGPFDVRTNFYLPISDTTQTTSLSVIQGSTQFRDDNLTYNQSRSWFAAMKGVDAEVGLPVPSNFAVERNIRVYGGGYTFAGDDVDSITGVQTRIQGNVIAGLDASLQVTYDDFYHTRAFVGVSWTFGALHRLSEDEATTYSRIGEHVNRNYTVVAPGRHTVEQATALNPATGTPYTFAHVSSSAGAGGTGSASDPFQSLAAAQASGRGIVFVHSDSVFSGADASVVLNSGQRLLGDGSGVQNMLSVHALGSVSLPHASGSGLLPILNGSPGDTVVLASNTEFANFTITNSGGNAIYADGAQNVTLRNLRIDGAAQDGLRFYNGSGNISTNGLLVTNSGRGVDIQGGKGLFQFLGTTTVDNALSSSVLIKNLSSDATVTFADLNISHRQSKGLEVDNSQGIVAVTGTARITNEGGVSDSAVDLKNTSGHFAFKSLVVSDTTGNPGINLLNNTGTTTIDSLSLNSTNGTGLRAENGGALLINPTQGNGTVDMTKVTSITAVNGSAVDIKGTALNVNLSTVSVQNAARGISLENTTGLFAINGTGAVNTGGVIQNNTIGIYLKNTGSTGLQWVNLSGNGTGIYSENSTYLAVNNSTIANSSSYGIDALNTTSMVVNASTLTDNGLANIRGQFSEVRSYSYSFLNSDFQSAVGDNVKLDVVAGGIGSTMNLISQGSAFYATAAAHDALEVSWNGLLAANINQSAFLTSGGSGNGIAIANASTTGLTTLAISNSIFQGNSNFDTGVHLTANGPSQVNLVKNNLNFDATNNTGFRMSLAASTTVNIVDNTIASTNDGATGILFDSITVPARVTIENNVVSLANIGGLLDRGIIFSTVNPTATDFLILSGTRNNLVLNADTYFYAPAGTTGSIKVNNIDVH